MTEISTTKDPEKLTLTLFAEFDATPEQVCTVRRTRTSSCDGGGLRPGRLPSPATLRRRRRIPISHDRTAR